MLRQQQQQQPPTAPTVEQLLHFIAQQSEAIATLQQQLLTMQAAVPTVAAAPVVAPIVEVVPPPKFNGERGQVVGFINACHLFIQMRIGQVTERSRISWVLSCVQGRVVEIWKDNVLNEITKGTSVVNMVKGANGTVSPGVKQELVIQFPIVC